MLLSKEDKAKKKSLELARMADQLEVIAKALLSMLGGFDHSTNLKAAQIFLARRSHDKQMEYLARLHGHGDAFHDADSPVKAEAEYECCRCGHKHLPADGSVTADGPVCQRCIDAISFHG